MYMASRHTGKSNTHTHKSKNKQIFSRSLENVKILTEDPPGSVQNDDVIGHLGKGKRSCLQELSHGHTATVIKWDQRGRIHFLCSSASQPVDHNPFGSSNTFAGVS